MLSRIEQFCSIKNRNIFWMLIKIQLYKALIIFSSKFSNNKRQFGNVVFSRYPLINQQRIPYESKSNISSQCDVVVGKDTIRLIVNHLESYKLDKKDMKLAEELSNSPVVQKVQDSDLLRHRQAKEVKRYIRKSPHPVIVVGDFNAIPLSLVYWKIKFETFDKQ